MYLLRFSKLLPKEPTKPFKNKMKEISKNNYNIKSRETSNFEQNKNIEKDNEKICEDKPKWYEAHKIAIEVTMIFFFFFLKKKKKKFIKLKINFLNSKFKK